MIRFLLFRPVAVLITTLALVVLGLVVFRQIPVSLLPDIAVPEITVQVSYPAATARELQQAIVLPIRNQLQQVSHVEDLEATIQDGLALIKLRFDYGTDVHLAYIETNEKIDGIIGSLPRDMPRPRVLKANAGDIPVFYLNISPQTTDGGFNELSEFCENVVRRRIEQLPEVALVDMTGQVQNEIVINPDRAKMQSLGLTDQRLAELLRQNNLDLGNVTVKDGYYQYNIRFASVLRTVEDIENIYFKTSTQADARLLQLKEIARVQLREQKLKGLYTFNGERAISMAIIKQSDAQLLQLRTKLNDLIATLRQDYPNLRFEISQDQTELLEISINNLLGNLLTGALLTFVMIFFFLNERRLPFIIGLVIPISLIVTFLGFYLLGLSINIVSLAGLVLGMGEIIDSAIIIIENIEDHRERGKTIDDACIDGANEVIVPLFTSILTNSAVFLPLIFLSGIAGSLFFDQAVSVSLALGVSLLCSYTLVPLLYRLVFRSKRHPNTPKAPTWLARQAERGYGWLFEAAFRHKFRFLALFVVMLAGGIWLLINIPKQGMPTVSQTELEVKIDWNEPLSVEKNQKRVAELISTQKEKPLYVCSYVGQQQFLLNRDLQQNFNEAQINLKTPDFEAFERWKINLKNTLQTRYPQATVSFAASKNVFEQLFNTTAAPIQVRVSSQESQAVIPIEQARQIRNIFEANGQKVVPIALQKQMQISINKEKLLLYDVAEERLYDILKTTFNDNSLGILKAEQRYVPLVLGGETKKVTDLLENATVFNNKMQPVPVKSLIETATSTDYKTLYAGKEGNYLPFDLDKSTVPDKIIRQLTAAGYLVKTTGAVFRNQAIIAELGWVILVAVALLYFILAAQFESLTQPLIVMITILFGISGALGLLYAADNSLNVMSAIGMVVLLGILDNDSILKIDTMNRSRDALGVRAAMKEAGRRRLKSQLMTFLTTILGVAPVLFSGGLGSELQQPLALAIIGGMTVGLFISLTLIPLLYGLTQNVTK
ncbi:MAG: efflux RND transporter permease subunit [Runella sp.]